MVDKELDRVFGYERHLVSVSVAQAGLEGLTAGLTSAGAVVTWVPLPMSFPFSPAGFSAMTTAVAGYGTAGGDKK